MTHESPSYFVIPIFRDEQGRPALGSRFDCRSRDNAMGLARWFVGRFLGAAVQTAGDRQVVATFGEIPLALRTQLAGE
jgi:hypothetical protein